VDTVAPTGSIVINDGDDITDDPEATLTLTYSDETSGVSQVRFSGDEFIGGDEPWENPVGTLEWDLGDTGGVMTVYYQVIDVAGMVSEVYSDTIILDTDKPTGSIELGIGATITNTPSIMLALTGVDATTEVVGIRVSNEAIGGDEPWEGPVEALPWILDAPDGEKTVYYQVLDAAGHVSQVYTLSLVLDTGNPYVEDSDPVDGIKDGAVDTSVVVRFSEAMNQTATSGATSMWTVDKDGNTVTVDVDVSWSPDGRTMTIDPRSDLEPGTEYTWAISADATDVAGNQIYPAVENTLTTAGGGGDGDGSDADDGFGLLMVLVAAIVVIVLVVVGLVWWLSKR
jgi:hypothetical protein